MPGSGDDRPRPGRNRIVHVPYVGLAGIVAKPDAMMRSGQIAGRSARRNMAAAVALVGSAAVTYALEPPRWQLKGVETLTSRIGTGNGNGDAQEVDEARGSVVRTISRKAC